MSSLKGLLLAHHAFIYQLHIDNPARPLDGYVEELHVKFGLIVNCDLLRQWFAKAGNFAGNLRQTSTFNSGRNDPYTIERLGRYLHFMKGVIDHRRAVFADEKSMKDKDIYGKMRRNVMTGDTPVHVNTFSSANRYNILAAVTVKGGNIKPVEYIVLD